MLLFLISCKTAQEKSKLIDYNQSVLCMVYCLRQGRIQILDSLIHYTSSPMCGFAPYSGFFKILDQYV